ncbi:hypothetical protein CLOP_g726, partial [Closterium sp. NIES-67]
MARFRASWLAVQ